MRDGNSQILFEHSVDQKFVLINFNEEGEASQAGVFLDLQAELEKQMNDHMVKFNKRYRKIYGDAVSIKNQSESGGYEITANSVIQDEIKYSNQWFITSDGDIIKFASMITPNRPDKNQEIVNSYVSVFKIDTSGSSKKVEKEKG